MQNRTLFIDIIVASQRERCLSTFIRFVLAVECEMKTFRLFWESWVNRLFICVNYFKLQVFLNHPLRPLVGHPGSFGSSMQLLLLGAALYVYFFCQFISLSHDNTLGITDGQKEETNTSRSNFYFS